jgi:hypothetical protein
MPFSSLISGRFVHASQLLVRSVAGINLVVFGWSLSDPRFSHLIANSPMSGFIFYWAVASSVILPILVGLEFKAMRAGNIAKRAMWIDGCLAGFWFLLLWGSVFYAFTHYAII